MANELKILWDTITEHSTITNLNSLSNGYWWQSGQITEASPTSSLVRIWWKLVFNTTPTAGDFLWFKIARGDQHASEIWDAVLSETESEISTIGNVVAIDQAPLPEWSHHWVTNHGTTFQGSKIISMPGHAWQLLISARGKDLAASGHAIHYQYGNPQVQS